MKRATRRRSARALKENGYFGAHRLELIGPVLSPSVSTFFHISLLDF